MSNALNIELKGKTVIMKSLSGTKAGDMRFLCEDGFGCSPNTNGTKIFGRWLTDGTKGVVNGYTVEKLAE